MDLLETNNSIFEDVGGEENNSLKHKIALLKKYYVENQGLFKQRIAEFENVGKSSQMLFPEMVFCLLTPQTRATAALEAVQKLHSNGLINQGEEKEIAKLLRNVKGVRFHNNKAKNIVIAQKKFFDFGLGSVVSVGSLEERNNLYREVRGFGLKEASHYLRNVGLGKEVAILDRHILNNLQYYEVINEIPKSISEKNYFEIEEKMKQFSRKIKIPLGELDLVFWSKQTGNILK